MSPFALCTCKVICTWSLYLPTYQLGPPYHYIVPMKLCLQCNTYKQYLQKLYRFARVAFKLASSPTSLLPIRDHQHHIPTHPVLILFFCPPFSLSLSISPLPRCLYLSIQISNQRRPSTTTASAWFLFGAPRKTTIQAPPLPPRIMAMGMETPATLTCLTMQMSGLVCSSTILLHHRRPTMAT